MTSTRFRAIHITRRDMCIQAALCNQVRMLALRQIADGFFAGNVSQASWRMQKLVSAKVLVKQKLVVRQLPTLTSPIWRWSPGIPTPNYFRLSNLLKRRWSKLPTRPTVVYLAAKGFASVVGRRTSGRITHSLQVSHDLGLAWVYLHFLSVAPELASRWIGEDATSHRSKGGAKPDAVILDQHGIAQLAIEFGGVYSAKRLEKFHRHCLARSLAYEIW